MKYNELEKWEYLKGFYRYKLDNIDATRNDYNCVKELREKFPQVSFHIPPKTVDITKLSFDDEHINKQRNHNVTEEMAKSYIRDAKASRTVWSGQFERYYSYDGVTYVNTINQNIKTAYSNKEFDDTRQILEVLKKYGI